MFKQAVIYYPTNEKVLKQINEDIAAFYCNAAVKYMDTLKLNDNQKIALLNGLAEDIAFKKDKSK